MTADVIHAAHAEPGVVAMAPEIDIAFGFDGRYAAHGRL